MTKLINDGCGCVGQPDDRSAAHARAYARDVHNVEITDESALARTVRSELVR